MSADNLTTREVARLLNVSEATVKRWADDGHLVPHRTIGGHRRFTIASIAQLRRAQGLAPVAQAGKRRTGKTAVPVKLPSVRSLTELMLQNDEAEVTALLISAYMQKHDPAPLFDEVVTPAMHAIGDLWFNGKITIADEHLATRIMENALQKLRALIVASPPNGLRALLCGVEGDLHELPIHLGEIIAESAGWSATSLGPNTPLFALREMAAHNKPQLICISARSITDLDRAATEYVQLRKVTGKINCAVLLGGEGFRSKTLRSRFPSDYYADSFKGFAGFIKELARKSR